MHITSAQRNLIIDTVTIMGVLLALQLLLYLVIGIPYVARYGIWVIYLDLAIALLTSACLKMRQSTLPEMSGMMVAMTLGMQGGLLLGTIIAATNGLFLGGLLGMLAGTLLGIVSGWSHGTLALLEGMMAGMMNGLMGSMIGTMFFADRLHWLMPFFVLINLAITVVLMSLDKSTNARSWRTNLSWSIVVASVLVAIVILGPKSGLARF